MKKTLRLALLALVVIPLLFSCSKKENEDSSLTVPAYNEVNLGQDYTDLKAEIKFITHRTDLATTDFVEDVAAFNKMYPNIKVNIESIANYVGDMMTRLTSPNWGDICMIPTNVTRSELSSFFLPLAKEENVKDKYSFLTDFTYDGIVYGFPSMGNAQGIVYNKRIFTEAGITELPKTPEEFISALHQIKAKTDAIPLYTNYAAGWTMTAWDAYISGSATGDPDFQNVKMAHTRDPFANRGDGTGPYAVYDVLYQAVYQGLTEDDPTTTDWESSKVKINNGEIATMVLGSWAVPQMQSAGPNAEDIGYMTFPITVNGKQYASAGGDYTYGININSSKTNQIASMLFIKYMVEESGYAFEQGGIPPMNGSEYPDTLKAFEGIEFVVNSPAPTEEADLYLNINDESELSLNADQTHTARVVEAGFNKDETLDDIVADWNKAWNKAMDKYGV